MHLLVTLKIFESERDHSRSAQKCSENQLNLKVVSTRKNDLAKKKIKHQTNSQVLIEWAWT